MKYRVHKIYEVEADSAEAAQDVAGELVEVRMVPVEHRGHLQLYEGLFAQPTAILDWAWDEYHERDVYDWPGIDQAIVKMPSFLDVSLAGLNPVHLSLLFDLAITAYKNRQVSEWMRDWWPKQR